MGRPSLRRTSLLLLACSMGIALRLWFILVRPQIAGDTLIYGDIAQNWFFHHIYGLTRDTQIHPTLIRLPGYPLFLGLCFSVFGAANYRAVLFVQAALDLLGCGLLARFAYENISPRAGLIALFLTMTCPFPANYVCAPLTETPSIFCVSLAIFAFGRLFGGAAPAAYRKTLSLAFPLALLGFALAWATLLRPDGALLTAAVCPAILICAARGPATKDFGWKDFHWARGLQLATICGLLAVLPLLPWAIRNWRTFHVIQPLAPRYANDPGEFVNRGFTLWVKTWLADSVSNDEVYWRGNSDTIDIALLPRRAFDSAEEYRQTAELLDLYNQSTTLDPPTDQSFADLANQRIAAHPLRFHVELPALRLMDMWFRPRTDLLWFEPRWWEYWRHRAETREAIGLLLLNGFYIAIAAAGLRRRVPFAGWMAAFVLLRCALLFTLENAETRYTLECFPVLFVFGAAALAASRRRLPATFAERSSPQESSA